jgi:hypothetical protein
MGKNTISSLLVILNALVALLATGIVFSMFESHYGIYEIFFRWYLYAIIAIVVCESRLMGYLKRRDMPIRGMAFWLGHVISPFLLGIVIILIYNKLLFL